ncbi:hypothetical protein GCM10023321_14880 [Pseudonocardia eucalypti]|uniref:DUF222 domain-containing protein n=1 Tax=Pseudonocardia eucalypti TaxID=648755 RepID=A0ABP9PW66_9PSEU|nr:hypothetical protein [Pseudonocardia eucalypti]
MDADGGNGVGVPDRAGVIARMPRLTATALEQATEAFLGGAPVVSTTLRPAQRALPEIHVGLKHHTNGLVHDAHALLTESEVPSPAHGRSVLAEPRTNAGLEQLADLARQVGRYRPLTGGTSAHR